jgi:3-hydroxyisobutyrate dehydrogenase-like beta-hydroxyacid dehydrogenase
MNSAVAFLGFGEAAMAFAGARGAARLGAVRGFDIKIDQPDRRAAKLADFQSCGVHAALTLGGALAGAAGVLSLVTADQALDAAFSAAPLLPPGALYFDMNSVAPDTKRAAAGAIEAAGGRYVDVAVMAPVHPARLGVPLLVSGPHAEEGAAVLQALGFANLRVVAGPVGVASSIKMIRSVMVKGLEALTAECLLAAHVAGITDEVVASLDAGDKPKPWAEWLDYNLDRMLVHGLRRAAEMEEVVKTLQSLGTGSIMTESAVARQRAIGKLGAVPPPEGLFAKVSLILDRKADHQ